ncbi:MAG TPA: hypothetical protein VG738_20520 [Chitinophagaceae bacterium]|nr:hypothetical protein [Chitinophagaceae bacterium]
MIRKIIIFLIYFATAGAFVNIGNWSDILYPVILLLVFIALLFSAKKIQLTVASMGYQFLFFFTFTSLILVREESFTFGSNLQIIAKFFIVFLLSVYISTFYPTKLDFYSDMVRVFEGLLKFSFLTFALTNALPFLMQNIGPRTPIGDQYLTFFGVAYGRAFDYAKYRFYRNQSFFWEPGVFGVLMICCYIFKTIYLQNKEKKWIYYIGVFSTLSMGAIIIFLAFNGFKKVLSGSSRELRARLPIISILVGLPLLLLIDLANFYSSDMETAVSLLFHRNVSNDKSLNTRSADLYYGYLAAKDEIVAGHGEDYKDFYRITLNKLNTTKAWYNGGITNGVIDLLYCYGIIYTILFLIMLYKASRGFATLGRYTLLVFFTFMGLLMVEPLQYSLLFMLIITYRQGKKIST